MKIVATGLMACMDCVDAIEFSDDELGYVPGTLFKQMGKIRAVWDEAAHAIFVSDDVEPTTFSTSLCDTCKSPMAGSRFSYTLMAP